MKSILFFCLLFGLLLLSGVTHAEGNCPEGYYPIGGESGQAGPQGCAPIPGYNQQQGQQQAPQPPPPQWATRWGAIAVDSDKGVLGTTTDTTDKSAAEQGAIADCHAKGGITCKLEIAYDNECASLVVSKEGHAATAESTVDKAVQLGMKTCTNAGYHNCHAGYTACSLPVRIR